MGEQFGLQGETVTVEADGGGAHSLSSDSISIGISKVARDKMKRFCAYSPKSQSSGAPHILLTQSESSQQCSERTETWWSCFFALST